MTVQPVQLNNENIQVNPALKAKEGYKPYLEKTGAVKTDGKVKPLPPKGHLVDDNIVSGTKYFFKDIAYDMKSVKNGIKGTANDHQLGRLNDVGLRLGGIGIAVYLASRTSNPKARIMEYVGLGTFLAMMDLYPKVFINTPARILHGYDIDKQYIDDQGRKKSVQQDSNYVPYDMYMGGNKSEDIDRIGDKMGIPRNIKNRHDVIREQMRKIATQNNTLWMLTAGFATPILTALACCGIENYIVSPALAKSRNKKADAKIADLLDRTSNMKNEVGDLRENNLSKSIEKVLNSYKNQEIPQEAVDNIVKIMTEGYPSETAEALKNDITELLIPKKLHLPDDKFIANLKNLGQGKRVYAELIAPQKEEIQKIIEQTLKDHGNDPDIEQRFTEAIGNMLDEKIAACGKTSTRDITMLKTAKKSIMSSLTKGCMARKAPISEESINKVVNLAKALGEFGENRELLENVTSFKFEYAPDTVIARTYSKFEKTLIKELGLSTKELEKMRKSDKYTQEILDKKFSEICADKTRYENLMKKLGDVLSEMEINLNGSSADKSSIKDLITAIEYNYNNTAKRLANIDLNAFSSTIKSLIAEDSKTANISIGSKQELFDFLDGLSSRKGVADHIENIKIQSKGYGSAKFLDISKIFERYQQNMNSFNRVLHTLDTYRKLFTDPNSLISNLSSKKQSYIDEVIKEAKNTMLSAKAPDHFVKLNTINAPDRYLDIMNMLFRYESGEGAKAKGAITEETKNALEKLNGAENGNLLDRFQYYIMKFKNLVTNNTKDFTKPEHIADKNAQYAYSAMVRTPKAISNLVGQDPVSMVKGGAERMYGNRKWTAIVGSIAGGVTGITLLSQFAFGKLKNPHNLQKQVKDDSNK